MDLQLCKYGPVAEQYVIKEVKTKNNKSYDESQNLGLKIKDDKTTHCKTLMHCNVITCLVVVQPSGTKQSQTQLHYNKPSPSRV